MLMKELVQQYLIFIVVNLVLLATANSLVWRYYENELNDVFDWLIMMFLFAVAEILVILALAGFLGELNLTAMIWGVIVCFGFGGVRIPFLGRYFSLGALGACKKL